MPRTPPLEADHYPGAAELHDFFAAHERVAVLTGAGCSTGSGIPDYRDDSGNWKHRQPMCFAFGEPVPAERVAAAAECVLAADALLVVGSSLMVLSGFRFARMACEAGLPVTILNRGVTRADGIATHKLAGDCGELLAAAAGHPDA